jgi:hypothetical protein
MQGGGKRPEGRRRGRRGWRGDDGASHLLGDWTGAGMIGWFWGENCMHYAQNGISIYSI